MLELASREADELRHEEIEPAHLVLALIHEGQGVAAQVLARLGVDLEDVERGLLHGPAAGG